MNQTQTAKSGQIAGILCIVMAVLSLLGALISPYLWSFWLVLEIAAYGYLAAILLIKRRDFLLSIGYGVLLILALRNLFLGYGFLVKLLNLFQVLAFAAMALVALGALTDLIPSLKDSAKKYWYAPAGCMVICIVPAFLSALINLFRGLGFLTFLLSIITAVVTYGLLAACLYFAAVWITEPEKLPIGGASRPQYQRPQGQYQQPQYQAAADQGPRVVSTDGAYAGGAAAGTAYAGGGMMPESAYCGLAKHVLLLLFTCGIWYLIWIYRTTENLNCLEEEPPRNPATKLLLCMFVPFYSIYWVYKSAQRIDRLSALQGRPSDSATLCLILSIVIAIVPPILMQDKINGIVTAQGNGWTAPQQAPAGQARYAAPQSPYTAPQTNAAGAAEELKKYKELLDMGAITQEEFDEKKKQLLGL